MESKCQGCFYYKLCVQHDYIVEDEKEITNNYCGIREKGIPSKIWNEKEECEEFVEICYENKYKFYKDLENMKYPNELQKFIQGR